MQTLWAIVLAAGEGRRLAAHTGQAKQFMPWQGKPLYWHSALTLARVARVQGLIFVFPPSVIHSETEQLEQLTKQEPLNIPWRVTSGGVLRQDSVRNGLLAMPQSAQKGFVLVHDAARPFATPNLCNRLIDALGKGHPAVIPGLAVTDTIKVVENHLVSSTPDRSSLVAVQTPQAFSFPLLLEAHKKAFEQKLEVTDDAALMEACGHPVLIVAGEGTNRKLTTVEDLSMLQTQSDLPLAITSFGYDVHRFTDDTVTGRPMRLGGVLIPKAPCIEAHSDGDTLLHALSDALLGCCGAGDIGQLFPDNDPQNSNLSSTVILDEALNRFQAAGCSLTHIDITVITQIPKIAPHREAIRKNLCRLLSLPLEAVSVKATTEEGLGFTGQKQGIKVCALASAQRARPHSC